MAFGARPDALRGSRVTMENPKIKTKVVHSQTKSAWNVVGTIPGLKYKIARVPYVFVEDEDTAKRFRLEAFEHAVYISQCFNHSDAICAVILEGWNTQSPQ